MHKEKRPTAVLRPVLIAFVAIFMSLFFFGAAMAQTIWENQDDSVAPFAAYEGQYQLTIGAVGVLELDSATVSLDVPGTPVAAYVIWAARQVTDPEANTILEISINGGAVQAVEATHGWYYTSIPNPNPPNANLYSIYLSPLDVSDMTTGLNTVELFNYDSPTLNLDYGGSVSIVSTDPSFPEGLVTLYVGLDGFFWRNRPPMGEDSAVSCDVFPEALTEDYFYELNLIVAGIDQPIRPNRVWYMIGSGATPSTLINQPGAIVVSTGDDSPYPLSGENNQNSEQDIDHFFRLLTLPPGTEWVCAQIESWNEQGDGASGVWHTVAGELTPADPTAVGLMATNVSSAGDHSWLLWPAAALLIVTALAMVAASRKRQAPLA